MEYHHFLTLDVENSTTFASIAAIAGLISHNSVRTKKLYVCYRTRFPNLQSEFTFFILRYIILAKSALESARIIA